MAVGAERTAQAEAVVTAARETGADGVAHGSTGAGNDGVRFDAAFRALAPDLAVIAPIRELALSRDEEADYLEERGFAVDRSTRLYSLNEGLWGVTIGGGDATREFVTKTVHAEPDGTSNQTVRSVHWDTGTGNFLGEIKVARHAQKTDAAQDFKGLLLEAGASANAVPQLEIFADDVKCAHGATVGQLDESARYYMAARGLSPEQARRLLVQAFLGDAFVSLGDEAERARLLDAALEKLEGRER